jgi:hypothetical protein
VGIRIARVIRVTWELGLLGEHGYYLIPHEVRGLHVLNTTTWAGTNDWISETDRHWVSDSD